jgi:hypothetical protein
MRRAGHDGPGVLPVVSEGRRRSSRRKVRYAGCNARHSCTASGRPPSPRPCLAGHSPSTLRAADRPALLARRHPGTTSVTTLATTSGASRRPPGRSALKVRPPAPTMSTPARSPTRGCAPRLGGGSSSRRRHAAVATPERGTEGASIRPRAPPARPSRPPASRATHAARAMCGAAPGHPPRGRSWDWDARARSRPASMPGRSRAAP